MRIGSVIQQERKRKNMSRRELSEMCDVSMKTIYNIESGKRNPQVDILVKILDGVELRLQAVRK